MTVAAFVGLYLAGLATFASPCILPLCVGPVLGATLSYAASHSASPQLVAAELVSYALGLSTPLVALAIAAPRVLAVARRLALAAPLVQRGMRAALVAMGLLIATDRVNLLAPKALTTTVAQTPTAAHRCAITGANACLPSADEARADIVADVPTGRAHLIEFVSPHCTVCVKTAPLVAELERECTGNDGSIVRVDVETTSGRALAERFAVHAVPTFLELDARGAELSRLVGEQSRQELELALATLRGEACSLL